MLDCETLHLFVKPEIYEQGLAGLRGHSIFMGPPGTEVRCVAEEILKFIGLTGGKDFVVDSRGYDEMMKSPNAMPDAIFSLSPLPSPLGEKLVRQFGYQLLELPMGEALSLRKPCFEDILIPADTYGASPAVPQKQIHSIGVRGVLIAHRGVPSIAVERLLEVFYESDFACRANIKKLDPALLQRSGDYPAHRGTIAYMHRADPWPFQKLLTKLQGFIGSVVSVLSAILLAWHWIRRKKVEVGPYQQECTPSGPRRPTGRLPGRIWRGRTECLPDPVGTAQGRSAGAAPPAILQRRQRRRRRCHPHRGAAKPAAQPRAFQGARQAALAGFRPAPGAKRPERPDRSQSLRVLRRGVVRHARLE